jgi:hypothetical protein
VAGAVEVSALGRGYFLRFHLLHFLRDSDARLPFFRFLHFFFCAGPLCEFPLVRCAR